jgi:two-component system sensor histidine kinase UhpB
VALGTGLYTLQANRKTFERLHHLAEKLQSQSEQLRMLSWKLIEVQEQTLRQVARDLHDHFGQIFTAIGVMLGGREEKRRKPIPSSPKTCARSRRLWKIPCRACVTGRRFSVPRFWMTSACNRRWVGSRNSTHAPDGCGCALRGKLADGLFPPEAAIHVYRIVQEALSNITRHSGAREAWVTLREKDKQLQLEIRDNGKAALKRVRK